jgi:hypothetical protein
MDDDSLLEELKKGARLSATRVDEWRELSGLLAVLDAIGRDGANALLKIDGERPADTIYTVLISGGRLGQSFFRRDGGDLRALLREAILFYREHVWSAGDQP